MNSTPDPAQGAHTPDSGMHSGRRREPKHEASRQKIDSRNMTREFSRGSMDCEHGYTKFSTDRMYYTVGDSAGLGVLVLLPHASAPPLPMPFVREIQTGCSAWLIVLTLGRLCAHRDHVVALSMALSAQVLFSSEIVKDSMF